MPVKKPCGTEESLCSYNNATLPGFEKDISLTNNRNYQLYFENKSSEASDTSSLTNDQKDNIVAVVNDQELLTNKINPQVSSLYVAILIQILKHLKIDLNVAKLLFFKLSRIFFRNYTICTEYS